MNLKVGWYRNISQKIHFGRIFCCHDNEFSCLWLRCRFKFKDNSSEPLPENLLIEMYSSLGLLWRGFEPSGFAWRGFEPWSFKALKIEVFPTHNGVFRTKKYFFSTNVPNDASKVIIINFMITKSTGLLLSWALCAFNAERFRVFQLSSPLPHDCSTAEQ